MSIKEIMAQRAKRIDNLVSRLKDEIERLDADIDSMENEDLGPCGFYPVELDRIVNEKDWQRAKNNLEAFLDNKMPDIW